ncbi:hypothetical protein ONZ51_g13212 [Trametes cubensis]|uniref:Threonine/serine exporter-like N-terminal domain-containing protein n=1 Tax=Trametes cubensis TaxID=1111947 RepID=A0AAD7TEP6_9APHY|nr:hypothetical protein ONZ51_g13212 [Trametes cubensis]
MPYTDLPPRRSSLSRRSGENATGSRRGSRVHFDDEERPSITDDIVREYAGHSGGPAEDTPVNVPEASHTRRASVDWNIPDYEHDGVSPATPRQRGGNVSPRGSRNEGHRDSDATLYEIAEAARSPESKYSTSSFASYKHPDDIRPPSSGLYRLTFNGDSVATSGSSACSMGWEKVATWAPERIVIAGGGSTDDKQGRSKLYRRVRHNSFDSAATTSTRYDLHRMDSFASNGSQVLDPDDPTVTGERKNTLDDPEDVERACLKQMNYKARRKLQQRVRIEFNITSVINRQKFLMRLAKALMTFGAPSHRIESQLLSAARILEVDAEFIHIPGVIILRRQACAR